MKQQDERIDAGEIPLNLARVEDIFRELEHRRLLGKVVMFWDGNLLVSEDIQPAELYRIGAYIEWIAQKELGGST